LCIYHLKSSISQKTHLLQSLAWFKIWVKNNKLTWKARITEEKTKAAKRMSAVRSLAGKNWGADQGIHEMFIFQYWSTAA
jgi:hypothetical protein